MDGGGPFTGVVCIPTARIRWSVDFIAVIFAAAGVQGIVGRLLPLLGQAGASNSTGEA